MSPGRWAVHIWGRRQRCWVTMRLHVLSETCGPFPCWSSLEGTAVFLLCCLHLPVR